MSNSASHSYIQSHKHTIYIVSVTTSKVTSEHKLQILLQILFIYNLFFSYTGMFWGKHHCCQDYAEGTFLYREVVPQFCTEEKL